MRVSLMHSESNINLSFKTETLSLENRYYKYMNAVDFTLDSQPRIRLNVL